MNTFLVRERLVGSDARRRPSSKNNSGIPVCEHVNCIKINRVTEGQQCY